MKKFLIVSLILLFSLAFAGDKVYNYDIRYLFEYGVVSATLDASDVTRKAISDLSYNTYALTTGASAADQFISKTIPTYGSNKYTIEAFFESVAGTMYGAILLGKQKGIGLINTDVEGWEYTVIDSIIAGTDSTLYFSGAVLADTSICEAINIKYVESGNQSNNVTFQVRVRRENP